MIRNLGDHNHWDLLRKWSVLVSVYKNGSNGNFDGKDVLAQISYGFEALLVYEKVWVNSGNQFGNWGVQNWDFGVKNEFFVTGNCQYSPRRVSLRARRATWSQRAMFARHGKQSYSLRRVLCHRGHVLSATASYSAWEASCLSSSFSIFASCVLFTYFYFELTLVTNMKVFKDFICFPMALNWFENTLRILTCDENSPSEAWWILKRLMLVNAYMFVDWVVIGEHICVNWIVNVSVITYMSCDDELLMNSCMHIC